MNPKYMVEILMKSKNKKEFRKTLLELRQIIDKKESKSEVIYYD